jgi:signal transduction histidine kinase/DNA-binding LytR/AlgR family response regulator/HPt (histidine-containing phosphotransfer) domain-containing protein
MKLGTVRAKIFVGMGAIILLFIAVSTVVISHVVDRFGREEVARDLAAAKTALTVHMEMRQRLLQDKGRALVLAPYLKATLALEDLDRETAHFAAVQLLDAAESELLLLLDHAGQLLADAKDVSQYGNDVSQLPIVKGCLSGEATVGMWQYKQQLFMAAATPIVVGKTIYGALVLGVRVDSALADEIHQATGQDILILHQAKLQTEGRSHHKPLEVAEIERAAALTLNPANLSKARVLSLNLGGKTCLATAASFGKTTIVLSRPMEDFQALSAQTWNWLVIVGGALGALAIYASQYISGKLSKPIRQVVLATEELSRGNWDVTVPVHGRDELGKLCSSFNTMAQRMKKLVSDVQHEAELAQAANRAKSNFLANMSHEIRTPMTAIIGYADIMRRAALREEIDESHMESIETIVHNGEHLLRLINDILDISKIEAGKLEFEQVPVSPYDLALSATELMGVKADEKNIDLDLRFGSALPRTLITDSTRLRQILVNLIGNAIKFTKSGQVGLTIFCPTPDQISFSVTDTGIGISAEAIEALFEPFTQSDSSMTRQYGGTGLGLSISQRLARLLGGDITCQSQPGDGSTFCVTIPIVAADDIEFIDHATVAQSKRRRPEPPGQVDTDGGRGARILLVEDIPTNQKLIARILKSSLDIQPDICENGQLGFEAAMEALDQGNPYDVILMDMQMPVLDGYSATRKLRARDYCGVIIALTAHAMAEDRHKCIAAGCDDYLVKPINHNEFVAKVVKYARVSQGVSNRNRQAPAIEAAPAIEVVPAMEVVPVTEVPAVRVDETNVSVAAQNDSPILSLLPIDDPDFQAIVVEFVDFFSGQLAEMYSTAASDDFDSLDKLAHCIKGAGGTAGFPDLTSRSIRLQTAAQNQQIEDINSILAEFTALNKRIAAGVETMLSVATTGDQSVSKRAGGHIEQP